MINAVINEDKLTLTMKGHAEGERNDMDHDLICGIASAYACQLVYSVHGHGYGEVTGKLDPGDTELVVMPATGRVMACKRVLRHVEDGLRMLEETHPMCIAVTTNKTGKLDYHKAMDSLT